MNIDIDPMKSIPRQIKCKFLPNLLLTNSKGLINLVRNSINYTNTVRALLSWIQLEIHIMNADKDGYLFS